MSDGSDDSNEPPKRKTTRINAITFEDELADWIRRRGNVLYEFKLDEEKIKLLVERAAHIHRERGGR